MADVSDRRVYRDVDYNNHRVKEVADPVAETDAVNKRYVDAAVASGGAAMQLADLSDVDTATYPPSEGSTLSFYPEAGRAGGGKWVAAPRTAGIPLSGLEDVEADGAVDGQVLALSGDVWVPVTVSTEVDWSAVPAPVGLSAAATNNISTSPLKLDLTDSATGLVAGQVIAAVGGSLLKQLSLRVVDDTGKGGTQLAVQNTRAMVTGGPLVAEYESSFNVVPEGTGTVTTISSRDGIGLGLDPAAPDTMITRAAAGVVAVDDRPVLTAVFSATEPVAPAVGAIWIKTQEGAQ